MKILFRLVIFFTIILQSAGGQTIAELENSEKAGDMATVGRLGVRYIIGSGVAKDEAKGFVYLYRAAISGDTKAARNLGTFYHRGSAAFPANPVLAFFWFREAANQGESNAQRITAQAYFEGDGIERDLALAYAWALIRKDAADVKINKLLSQIESVSSVDDLTDGELLHTLWKEANHHVMPLHGTHWHSNFVEARKPAARSAPTGSSCENGHWISSVISGGKYIQLEDKSLWRVSDVDTVDSGLWLTTEDIVVCDGKLINLDDNESVEATKIK